MPRVPKLAYTDLVDSKDGILIFDPSLIPIHPKVLGSQEFFTAEFMQAVHNRIPSALEADLEALDTRLRREKQWDVTETGYTYNGTSIAFERFEQVALPGRGIVSVRYGKSNASLSKNNPGKFTCRGHRTSTFCSVPMRRTITQAYACNNSQIPPTCFTWKLFQQDSKELEEPYMPYMRTFAIEFNNAGLDRLGW